jgi:Protein of unknown function (DUF3800)
MKSRMLDVRAATLALCPGGTRMHIYLDETGYTGRDIMNRDQPVYVLASTNLSDGDAAELKSTIFARIRSKELKHSSIASRGRGQAQIVELLGEIVRRKSVAVAVAHKPYTLLGLLVDFWIEPAMRRDGENLYERGANIALTNMLWVCLFSAYIGEEAARSVLEAAQTMLVERDIDSYRRFWTAWTSAGPLVARNPQIDEVLGYLPLSNSRLGGFRHLQSLPERLTDLGTYGLLESVSHWRELTAERIDIRHDRSSALSRDRELWEDLLSPDVPTTLVGQDRRTIQFPLNVGSIEFPESHEHDQLQLADLVAGAAATYYRHFYNGESTFRAEYARKLADAGIEELVVNVVWPTDAVDPASLGTDGPVLADAADFIAEQISSSRRRRE